MSECDFVKKKINELLGNEISYEKHFDSCFLGLDENRGKLCLIG
ncbi:MAG: hypothetical protein WC755_04950 [Candidatus Woesearchaeota archaeon]|jgi:hypothetical protein